MKLVIDIPDEQYEYIKKSDKNTFAAVSSKECMLYAIKNGTPVSTEGDLISREALKEAVQEYIHTLYHDDRPDLDYEYIDIDDLNYVIDNTPTVEPEKAKESELIKAYTKGFDTGVETVKNERPQGKWIRKYNGHKADICCTNCGYDEGYSCFKYCPHCGAYMEGDNNDKNSN